MINRFKVSVRAHTPILADVLSEGNPWRAFVGEVDLPEMVRGSGLVTELESRNGDQIVGLEQPGSA